MNLNHKKYVYCKKQNLIYTLSALCTVVLTTFRAVLLCSCTYRTPPQSSAARRQDVVQWGNAWGFALRWQTRQLLPELHISSTIHQHMPNKASPDSFTVDCVTWRLLHLAMASRMERFSLPGRQAATIIIILSGQEIQLNCSHLQRILFKRLPFLSIDKPIIYWERLTIGPQWPTRRNRAGKRVGCTASQSHTNWSSQWSTPSVVRPERSTATRSHRYSNSAFSCESFSP